MDASQRPTIRIYQEAPAEAPSWDAHKLASQELLRPVAALQRPRDIEPFSRAWFESVELKRYAPHGAWLQRILEFTRHSQETLLMIGPGLGSDALQYHRHGVDVTILARPDDPAELIQQNFELRGLKSNIRRSEHNQPLPFPDGAFDLVYLNLIYAAATDRTALVNEVYRVLKPGGKVFVLAPASYDVNFWQRILVPYRKWYHPHDALSNTPEYSGRQLRKLFPQFTEPKLSKRHLRTSDLPYVWRFIPLGILERLLGRIICLRAFKPISAAWDGLPTSQSQFLTRSLAQRIAFFKSQHIAHTFPTENTFCFHLLGGSP
jgi:SAM-dependent methyltransferase